MKKLILITLLAVITYSCLNQRFTCNHEPECETLSEHKKKKIAKPSNQ